MPSLEEQDKVKALLTEAVTVLCKNVLSYQCKFTIEGLLGITVDSQDVFLVNICEHVRQGNKRSTHNGIQGTSTTTVSGRHQGRAKKRKYPFPSGVEHNGVNCASLTYMSRTEGTQTERTKHSNSREVEYHIAAMSTPKEKWIPCERQGLS